MDYGKLLSRAGHIIWRNKIIWLFGFLAALGSGGGGGGNFNFRSSGRVNVPESGGLGDFDLPPEFQRALTQLLSNESLLIAIAVTLVVLSLIVGLIVALIAALGHAGMVDMTREADETETTSLGTGWRTGLRRMAPTFFIRFLLGLPTVLIVLAGLAPFLLSLIPLIGRASGRVANDAAVAGLLTTLFACFLPALCVGLLLSIPLQVLETLAIRALVLEDQGVFGGLRRGWSVLTGNLGQVLVLWLIFLVLGLLVGVVVGLPLGLIAMATALPLALLAAASPIFIVPLLLIGLLLGLLSAAIRSVVEAFTSAVWTLAYRQWSPPTGVPVPVA
jgi:hypothetical protein